MAGLVAVLATVLAAVACVIVGRLIVRWMVRVIGVVIRAAMMVMAARLFRDEQAGMRLHAGRRAQHGRCQRAPDGEHHDKQGQEPDAQKFHDESVSETFVPAWRAG